MSSGAEGRWKSLLFVPANRPQLAAKAPRSAPDAVVLDLEDAVPAAEKATARDLLAEAFAALPADLPVCVRVNPPLTPLFADDVASLPDAIFAVVVPKLEPGAALDTARTALTGRRIVAGIETVLGVVDAREVLAPDQVVAGYFGAEDYIADLGGVRTAGNDEVTTARSLVGMAGRVTGTPLLDMVTLDFGDDERFLTEARDARALGYTGKLCIHPAQVARAHEAFRPTPDEISWAEGLLEVFDAAGGVAIAFEGQMVDEVVAARARAILAASDP